MALIRAGDSKFPEIDAETADFAYLRIMGTGHLPQGYDEAGLTRWADQARAIARTRDLYLYVISGTKHRNPAAAQALIARLT